MVAENPFVSSLPTLTLRRKMARDNVVDPRTFTTLYQTHGRSMRALARQGTRDPSSAHDRPTDGQKRFIQSTDSWRQVNRGKPRHVKNRSNWLSLCCARAAIVLSLVHFFSLFLYRARANTMFPPFSLALAFVVIIVVPYLPYSGVPGLLQLFL